MPESAAAPNVPGTAASDEDARLESLGYQPQLNRVLGFFANFAVAFTYLSPMVGIYSLFILGVGSAGPAYIWLTFIPLIGMLFVALVFGELASHYPVAGALYQYSQVLGRARLRLVRRLVLRDRAAGHGRVRRHRRRRLRRRAHAQLVRLTNWDPTNHTTILLITLVLLAIQTTLNITGAKVMGRVAQFGVDVEILGTFGIALILAIHGFHHGLGFLFSTQGAHARLDATRYGVSFHGSWLAGAR